MLLRFNTEIQNLTDINLSEYTEAMQKTVAHTFLFVQSHWRDMDAEISTSITLVTNSRIQSLNHQFRRINQPTDVLSFPLWERAFFLSDTLTEDTIELGDIVLSADRAIEQALQYEHSLKRELCFLTVHSMLHLLGFDHMTPQEDQAMTAMQEEILAALGIDRFTSITRESEK